MRKALASKLIRLAHFIYRPRVTETAGRCPDDTHVVGPAGRCPCGRAGGGSGIAVVSGGQLTPMRDPYKAADCAIYTAGPMGPAMQAEYERRESRGWN